MSILNGTKAGGKLLPSAELTDFLRCILICHDVLKIGDLLSGTS